MVRVLLPLNSIEEPSSNVSVTEYTVVPFISTETVLHVPNLLAFHASTLASWDTSTVPSRTATLKDTSART